MRNGPKRAAAESGEVEAEDEDKAMALDLGLLIKKLNPICYGSLNSAAALCQSKTNPNVEVEHCLHKLLEQPTSDFDRVLRYYNIDPGRLRQDVDAAIDRLPTGYNRTPSLSRSIEPWLREAWVLSSAQYSQSKIRSGVLLAALLNNDQTWRIARDISRQLERLYEQKDAIIKDLPMIIANIPDTEIAVPSTGSADKTGSDGSASSEGDSVVSSGSSRNPALDKYTIDLTARARSGKIDPVLGRDSEIRQMVDILIRRRQNNPILTGEAGVGKTAVVEGFALRVAEGDVPDSLKEIAVRVLDMGLLQAGAGVKGEFENRLKEIINEVKASPKPIILFIDEAHTMIGAGGQAGQSDAANLLKPALARGELRTIAATTWAEYKKYFEKDAALARRFQVVKVDEPNEDQAIVMMRGMTPMLEKHHQVRILDEAIDAAVRLSARYITGRQLPDKCLSLLDTACARVAISQIAIPPEVEATRRQIEVRQAEKAILEREQIAGGKHGDRLAEIELDISDLQDRQKSLETRWDQEKALVSRLRELRDLLEAASAKESADDAVNVDELRDELETKGLELATLQGETPLMHVCVTRQTVAEVISGWTGIPIGKMQASQIQGILNLTRTLGERVIGQNPALESICQRVRASKAGLTDPRRPVGVFMLVGPSGVGKTETALALADALFGGEKNLVTINMSEYQESHTVSSLKGSPPGYVGYGEGGVLTEAVRRKPYSVVLLDEIEKAHTDVAELFYQVFDKGMLEDGEGREIDFKNTIILLTSNLGSDKIKTLCSDPLLAPDPQVLAQELRPELVKQFKPAFLGRLAVVPYYPISDDSMEKIIRLQLNRVGARLQEAHKAKFVYSESLVKQIRSRCTEVESGARNVDHILTKTLLPEISQAVLEQMARGGRIESVQVDVGPDGEFQYCIS